MLKYAMLFAAVFCSVQSQRPWHAGSSNRLPQVLPQYEDERVAAAQAAQAQASQAAQAAPEGTQVLPETLTANVSGSFPSRIDGVNSNAEAIAPIPVTTTTTTTTTTIPPDLPVDAHGDVDLVNRIMTWPREKQPFWFINWQAIQAHRGDTNNSAQPVQTQPRTRSFFAG